MTYRTRAFIFLLLLLLALPVFAGPVLVSMDKNTQITLLPGWTEDRELHGSAQIQASNRANENYIIVISESKEDFAEMTLEKHSDITRGSLVKSITNSEVEGPTKLTINGNPAVQYIIRGTIGGINATYLHTTVETTGMYHQVLAWTLRSRFDKNKPVLQQVINSFKEVPHASVK